MSLSIGGEQILVDCGSLAVHRMLEHGVNPTEVETLFFTHHHIDHTADFFQFVISSWSLGRESLTVYGPKGTERFVNAIYDLFEDDIQYREWFGHGAKGIRDIDVVPVDSEFSMSTERWSVSALPVEHSIETYAYRFTETSTGQTCVISGDTRRIDELSEFASDADLLVQDCCLAPTSTDSTFADHIPNRLAGPISDEMRRKHKQNHCDPEDAGSIAAEAGVDRLVLTHLLPNRDHDAMRKKARTVFDGEIEVAADGMCISLDKNN
ncbi:MBL fold metallo-hydrolase [Halobellus captivus]|uniref:MBL fold metallo-hydrolase n=1 Tax=Halobellus captivus TaxID=2592614 RepID=UPI001939C351|nr:MBL fold metallo-hydrolase [Halobellus captivus]